jgi:dihydroflavonol-4-reductase
MATTLVTGATGFIGSHLARALAKRGDELRLLVRRATDVSHLAGLDFERVNGDVTDRRSVRRAVKGVDKVFHVAGITSLRSRDAERVFEVNLGGTELVLGEALEAGAKRVVYTSSVAALGPAPKGKTADERQKWTGESLHVPYVDSKHRAEEAALRLVAEGLPVVIVCPTFVFGPGDRYASSTSVVRRFLLGRIPAYVDGAINVVDVRDVAKGHLLADRKAKVGERYILGGRNFTFDRLFADLARLTGREPPIKLPGRLALAGASAAGAVSLPSPVRPEEIRSAMQWWTYRSTKAARELGWKPRPHEETLEATVRWHQDDLGDRVVSGQSPLPLRLAARLSRLGRG